MRKAILTRGKKILAMGMIGAMVLMSACSNKENSAVSGTEKNTKQTEKSAKNDSEYEDDFIWATWTEDAIAGFSETGMKKKDIVIPKRCKAFEGSIVSENMITLSFESDDDIYISVAFSENPNLKEVNLPKNITRIPNMAFQNCTSLESIDIPENVTEIGTVAFLNCESLKNIKLPDSVTKIGISAFEGCSSLTEITLPKNLVEIDDFAFESCTSLTEVTLPASLKSVGSSVFFARNLLTIYVEEGVELEEYNSMSFGGVVNPVDIYVVEGSWADEHFDEVFGTDMVRKFYYEN